MAMLASGAFCCLCLRLSWFIAFQLCPFSSEQVEIPVGNSANESFTVRSWPHGLQLGLLQSYYYHLGHSAAMRV